MIQSNKSGRNSQSSLISGGPDHQRSKTTASQDGGTNKKKYGSVSLLKSFKKLKSGSFRRGKSDASTGKRFGHLVISDPVLTSGLERVNQMHCVALDGAVERNIRRIRSSATHRRQEAPALAASLSRLEVILEIEDFLINFKIY